jgi:hypothetical protein
MALLQLSPLICPVQNYRRRLRFSFRLPPMRLVAVRMNSRTRCRLHDADPSQHRWTAVFRDQDQRFHRCLPWRGCVICFRSLVM